MKLVAIFLLAVGVLFGQPATDTVDCTSCHDTGPKVAASAHAAVGCQGCHERHEEYPHPPNVPKPVCGSCHNSEASDYALGVHGRALKSGNKAAPECATCHGSAHEITVATSVEFKKNVPDTCGMCHAEINEQFKLSVHGKAIAKGIMEAPVCTDCHGEHSIRSPKEEASTVNVRRQAETCGRCHGDVRLSQKFGLPSDRVVSFEASFHGLAAKSGSQTVAGCASCHGIHNILPSSDPKSMINARNLGNTCGSCHPGAGQRFAIGTIHWVDGQNEPKPVEWVRMMYGPLIGLTIGLMLIHHGGDFIRKLIAMRLRPVGGRYVQVAAATFRMYRLERIQHVLLALSFSVLVWSGFALRYPEAWWAKPAIFQESQYPLRGVIHRTAGVIMLAAGVFHLIALILKPELRRHWMSMLPRKNDLYEGLARFAYNVGARRAKPRVSPHSYVEKVEYWAVVWGTIIMGLTGGVLWFNRWTLEYLPKLWLDVARAVHFYEAVLASLAIVVWHFYSVIFDPEVYPMDPAWLTGTSVRRHEPEQESSPTHLPEQAASEEAETPNDTTRQPAD